jgi:hypothetical protein
MRPCVFHGQEKLTVTIVQNGIAAAATVDRNTGSGLSWRNLLLCT